jgi:hypothetical protein
LACGIEAQQIKRIIFASRISHATRLEPRTARAKKSFASTSFGAVAGRNHLVTP